MASVTAPVSSVGADGQATVSVTYDDVTRAISQVSWVVLSGVVEAVTVSQAGKPDVVTNNLQASGSKNVSPVAGYTIDAASVAVSWRSVV